MLYKDSKLDPKNLQNFKKYLTNLYLDKQLYGHLDYQLLR